MTQTAYPPKQTDSALPQQPGYEMTDADRERIKAIAEAWKAYHGELPKPLKQMPGQPDDNVLTNRCKAVVQAGKGFLFGKELEIKVEKDAPDGAQDFLDLVWGRKEVRIPLLQRLKMNGACGRNAFLRIVPSDAKPGRDTTYRLVPVDPAIVIGIETAPQDCETVLCYCIQYAQTEKNADTGRPQTVFYREEIRRIDPESDDLPPVADGYEDADAAGIDADVTWQLQHWTQVAASSSFEPKYGHWIPAGPPIVWPYPFPPMRHCQNLVAPNDPWGEADITPDLIGMNNSLNLLHSSINRIQKIYGAPIVWAKGVSESNFDLATGRVVVLPPSSDSAMGSVQVHSDVTNALKFAEDLRSDMDELSRVPGVATARIESMPRGNLSGIAIELLFQPLLTKTDEMRCTYGQLIIEMSQALLVLAGFCKRMDDLDIQLNWQSPLPHDDLQSVQAAIAKKEISIADPTLMEELGYDPDEQLKIAAEFQQKKQALMPEPFPPGLPATPLLPNQPPPAKPGAPGQPPMPAQGGPA